MKIEEHKTWCKQNGTGDRRVSDLLNEFKEGKVDSEEFKPRVEVLKAAGK
jgi:hypothetical protein